MTEGTLRERRRGMGLPVGRGDPDAPPWGLAGHDERAAGGVGPYKGRTAVSRMQPHPLMRPHDRGARPDDGIRPYGARSRIDGDNAGGKPPAHTRNSRRAMIPARLQGRFPANPKGRKEIPSGLFSLVAYLKYFTALSNRRMSYLPGTLR